MGPFETWGISGSTFLVVYVLLAVVVLVVTINIRRSLRAGRAVGVDGLQSRPEDVAYLNGGQDLAVYAALSAMHVDGSIATSGPRAVPAALRTPAAGRRTVVPQGVRLSLGGTEPVDPARVSHLAACAEALDAPLVSEHVSFVRAGARPGTCSRSRAPGRRWTCWRRTSPASAPRSASPSRSSRSRRCSTGRRTSSARPSS